MKIKIVVSVVVCAAWSGVKPLLATLCAYNKGTVQHDSKSFTLKYLTPKVDEYIDFNVLITNITLFEWLISLIIYEKIKTIFASLSGSWRAPGGWVRGIRRVLRIANPLEGQQLLSSYWSHYHVQGHFYQEIRNKTDEQ